VESLKTVVIRLTLATGTSEEIVLDVDRSELTEPEQAVFYQLVHQGLNSTPEWAAAHMFAKLGRPVDDWEAIGPVLAGLIEGNTEHLVVEG
jgi:hypothetical protein